MKKNIEKKLKNNKKTVFLFIVSLVIGFIIGFAVSYLLNR